MGTISIGFAGSFIPEFYKAQKTISAIQHGHVHAIREAIAHLKHECLPVAIAKDSKLRAAGHAPAGGFTEKDARWLDAHGAREPGAAIPTMEELLRSLAGDIDGALPPGWIFFLAAASVGEAGAMTYLSNGQRADMIATLREVLGKLEAGEMGTTGKPIGDQA